MWDERDRKILDIVQVDAAMPVAEIADRVGLSVSACWRRIRNMEEARLITRRVALVDRRMVNLPMTVFVGLRAPRHSMEWLEQFRTAIRDMAPVVEAYRLTGEIDYLLRVVVRDIEDYDAVYKTLISRLEFTDVVSFIGMEELKFTTAVPTRGL
jgi:Lrp/AsnC family transcriptional regulator